jgi:hypothetical protein
MKYISYMPCSIIELFLQAPRRSNCSTLVRSLTAVGWPGVRCSLSDREGKESDRGWRGKPVLQRTVAIYAASKTNSTSYPTLQKVRPHYIVTDQLHSARVFSLDIIPRAVVFSSGRSLLARGRHLSGPLVKS